MTQVIGTCRGKRNKLKLIQSNRVGGAFGTSICTFISAVNNLPTRSNMIQQTFFNLLFYLNQ